MRLKFALALAVGFLLVAGMRPEALPYLPGQSRYSDAVVAHWPSAFYLRESVLTGRGFPLWRETIMAGEPFAANPLNKTAYPPQWLALIFPPAVHLNILTVGHLLAAAVGMWYWARSLKLRDEAAVLAALAFALSPRWAAHLGAGHLDVIYALAWWPWLLLAVDRLVRAAQSGQGLGMAAGLLGMAAGLLFLADVRVSLYALMTAAASAVYGLLRLQAVPGERPRLRLLRGLVGAGLVGALLTAAVIVPLLLWSPYLSRAGMTPADAGVLALAAVDFAGLLLPPRATTPETLTYVGIIVLALALWGLWRLPRRHRWWLIAATGFVALYGMGANSVIWPLLARLAPGLLWFRVPSRIWLVAALGAPLLAGYGLHHLILAVERLQSAAMPGSGDIKKARLLAFGGLIAAGGCGLTGALALSPASGLALAVIGAGAGAAVLAALAGKLKPQTLALALGILTVCDLAWTGLGWVEWREPTYWLEPQRPLAAYLVDAGADRIYSPTYSLEQQVAEVYGLSLFGGVSPFQLSGVVSAVAAGSGVPAQGYSVVQPPIADATGDDLSTANRSAVPDTAVLALWRVSHIVAAYPISHARLRQDTVVDGVYVYSNLDYQPAQRGGIPDWPAGWPELPDNVAVLNTWTAAAALVSALAFVLISLGVAAVARRGLRGTAGG